MKLPSPNTIDFVEIYVFNAFQSMCFYRSVFGFSVVSYAGPETGLKDRVSYHLQQGEINLLISSAIDRDSPILNHVLLHDEGVKDIAFRTAHLDELYENMLRNGASPVLEPIEISDGEMSVRKAIVHTFGDTVHSLIERTDSHFNSLPFYRSVDYLPTSKTGLEMIDHFAVAVETGMLKELRDFYVNVIGFEVTRSEDVYTEDSGMNSVVVSNKTGKIKFVLVEGVSKKKKSQVENYVSYYGCSGVQHMAFSTKDIINTASLLQEKGVQFLQIPSTYYENIPPILKKTLKEKLKSIESLNILVDMDKSGYLMQMFTRPIQNRPTVFLEVIQRESALGFGSNNIKSLYKAVEEDQKKAAIND